MRLHSSIRRWVVQRSIRLSTKTHNHSWRPFRRSPALAQTTEAKACQQCKEPESNGRGDDGDPFDFWGYRSSTVVVGLRGAVMTDLDEILVSTGGVVSG